MLRPSAPRASQQHKFSTMQAALTDVRHRALEHFDTAHHLMGDERRWDPLALDMYDTSSDSGILAALADVVGVSEPRSTVHANRPRPPIAPATHSPL
eukprot:14793240-Alexandrium_andersonii.AAC.1